MSKSNRFAHMAPGLKSQRETPQELPQDTTHTSPPAEIVPGDDSALSESETAALGYYEGVIERGLKTFFEVGAALLRVRDLRLYRVEYGTFAAYCDERWGFRKSYANYLMDAAEIIDNLKTSTIVEVLPVNEAQTRPLAKLKDPDQQRKAWQRVVDTAPDGRITAGYVEQIVTEMISDWTPAAADTGEKAPQIIEHEPVIAEPAPAITEEPAADLGNDEIADLRQRLARVQAIIDKYQEQITRAQGYKPTSDRGEAVGPLLRAIDEVVLTLAEGAHHSE